MGIEGKAKYARMCAKTKQNKTNKTNNSNKPIDIPLQKATAKLDHSNGVPVLDN